jgi:alanine racemase
MLPTFQTKLIVSLGALKHNVNTYRSYLKPDVKIMAMVKALGYGAGDIAIGLYLEEEKLVDYLAVAYTDEGVELRKAGINLPIMVMNPHADDIEALLKFDLEPTLFNLDFGNAYQNFISQTKKPGVHLKMDSGMHRLGFHKAALADLLVWLKTSNIEVTGMYTHLAATPESEHDGFTLEQITYFDQCYDIICQGLGYNPLRHVLNSAGALRFPDYQYDMIRLGMGVYGLDPAEVISEELQPVSRFITAISQINVLDVGETVGYSRVGIISKDKQKIAVLPVGYADGYSRLLSNGNADVFINGKRCPTIGNVCMDMCFVDVTDVDCKPGDEVELFGPNITVEELAEKAQTITYEILTSIAGRVNRIYERP